MWNPSLCDCESSKVCKFDEYWDVRNCSYKKRFFSKLVLACENK